MSTNSRIGVTGGLGRCSNCFFPRRLAFCPVVALVNGRSCAPFTSCFGPPGRAKLNTSSTNDSFCFACKGALFVTLGAREGGVRRRQRTVRLTMTRGPRTARQVILVRGSVCDDTSRTHSRSILTFQSKLMPIFSRLSVSITLVKRSRICIQACRVGNSTIIRRVTCSRTNTTISPRNALCLANGSTSSSGCCSVRSSSICRHCTTITLRLRRPAFVGIRIASSSLAFAACGATSRSIISTCDVIGISSKR